MSTKRSEPESGKEQRPGDRAAEAGEAEKAERPEKRPHGEAQTSGTAAADERARLDDLMSQLEEANKRQLRLAADFENFKKRARQEQLETMQHAAATLAERLLPVLDDAERALEHAPEGVDEGWLKGVRMTFRKLEEILAGVGVERIEALGARFDPSLHEAIGSEDSQEQPEDTVLAELRPGYRMHDRVLRPALVKVARRPA
jgi:molecular chaperone GrpE